MMTAPASCGCAAVAGAMQRARKAAARAFKRCVWRLQIAVTIMRTLRTLAVHGRTVALTIHQPNSDITEMFDDFVLMARGQVMYAGALLATCSSVATKAWVHCSCSNFCRCVCALSHPSKAKYLQR